MADIPGDITSTATFDGSAFSGASFGGDLEWSYDADWIRIDLVAGVTYAIYGGVDVPSAPDFSYANVGVYDASGNLVASWDYSASGMDVRVLYTPTASGPYFVGISEIEQIGPGSYTVNVIHHVGTPGDVSYSGETFLTNGDDTYTGRSSVERIHGDLGNDTIYIGYGLEAFGGPGNDMLTGNGVDNFISGGSGADTIHGLDGKDSLFGDGGDDIVYGDAGDDSVYGGAGADRVFAETGADQIHGGDGADALYGGGDADTVYGEADADQLYGGDGADALYGGGDSDTIFGEADADQLFGGDGNDLLYGQAGNDVLHGEAGDDQLQGGDGNDQLDGGDQNDILLGEANDDQLHGGAGNDQLDGGDGADIVYGEDGDDTVAGGAGADQVLGGNGNDLLKGGAEDDVLTGGAGNDILHGGDGADTFLFEMAGAANGTDRFWDFATGIDKIAVRAADYGLPAGPLEPAHFEIGAAATGSGAEFLYNPADHTLSWDPDGAGGGAAIRLASLAGGASLAASDILVI